MASPSNTTLIFVPGAWHNPECYHLVADKLMAMGYNTDYVNLASVGPPQHLKDFQPDIDVIRKHITNAVDAGQRVVMVTHSYGGIPTSDAVHGLDYATRKATGQPGGVVHLFYCCSFIVPVGKSLREAFGGQDLPWHDISEDKMEVRPLTPEHIFYNDLPENSAKEWVAKLKPHSYQTWNSKVRYGMWQKVPSTYLYCLKDNAIPMFVQEMMVKEWAAGAGVTVRTETVDVSHSPFFSKPAETAAAIDRAAKLEL